MKNPLLPEMEEIPAIDPHSESEIIDEDDTDFSFLLERDDSYLADTIKENASISNEK